MATTRDRDERIARQVVDACIEVHRVLKPGLMERVYQLSLAHELTSRGLRVQREVPLPITYKGMSIDHAYRVDMIVEKRVLVESKCVPALLPIHEAQLLNYLRLTEVRIGFLINWKVELMRDGIRRMVNGY